METCTDYCLLNAYMSSVQILFIYLHLLNCFIYFRILSEIMKHVIYNCPENTDEKSKSSFIIIKELFTNWVQRGSD